MKIGIYIGNSHPESGGAYTFQKDIIDSVAQYSDIHEYFVFTSYAESIDCDPAIKVVSIKLKIYQKVYYKLTATLKVILSFIFRKRMNHQTHLMRLTRKYNIDIAWFMSTTFEEPGIPYIFTVWDLAHKYFPFFPEITMKGWGFEEGEKFYWRAVSKASLIITGTTIGKRDIINFYNIPPDKVAVVPFATPQYTFDFQNKNIPDSFFKTKRDFIFYPAQYWPHKNHVHILQALELLKLKFGKVIDVVFTGSDKGNLDFIKNQTVLLGLEDQVHFLGFVTREQLINLYKQAKMLVFPTYFGPDNLPPLEAFALGCPVIASNIPGASEQLGNNALLFNPDNAEELANGIHSILDNKKLRDDLIEKGITRAKSWTSKDYTGKVLKHIDELESLIGLWKVVRNKKIKVLHINSNDVYGGAAQEAYELVHRLDADCKMVVQLKESNSSKVIEFKKNFLDKTLKYFDKFLWKVGFKRAFKNAFNLSSSLNFTYFKLKRRKEYRDASIIHIHNIHGNYFDLSALEKIAAEKQIVWTLQDMWAITGGEAHTFGNENYKKGIAQTPYRHIYPLAEALTDRRQHFMNYKKALYERIGNRITLVPVSTWLEHCVLSSYVYNPKIKVKMINNAADTGIFQNHYKRNWQKPRILFFNIQNQFKGNDLFLGIMNSIQKDFDLYIVGDPLKTNIDYNYQPYINSRKKLSSLFNEVDFLVFPSLAESFGMTVLEAMACGVCVIASDVGGIPDMLDNTRGYLFKSGDKNDLLKQINYALINFDESRSKAVKASGFAKRFSFENNCRQYLSLYHEVLGLTNKADNVVGDGRGLTDKEHHLVENQNAAPAF